MAGIDNCMRKITVCIAGAIFGCGYFFTFPLLGAPDDQQFDRTRIRHLAEVYRIDPDEAEHRYHAILGRDRGEALASIEYLKRAKAFELAAATLAKVTDAVVKDNLIRFVATKPQFSRTVFDIALSQLEGANADSSNFDDGEYRAGIENTKKILAGAISGWLHIPKPRSASGSHPSADEYSVFITAAKEESRRTTADSPY